ncbi:MAG: histidine kinase [Trichormus sp.]
MSRRRIRDWEQGAGSRGDKGDKGDKEVQEILPQCPMPNAQCPMPKIL